MVSSAMHVLIVLLWICIVAESRTVASLGALAFSGRVFKVMVDSETFVGRILGSSIYSVTGVGFKDINPETSKTTPAELKAVQSFLSTAGYYFVKCAPDAPQCYSLCRSLECNKDPTTAGCANKELDGYFAANWHMMETAKKHKWRSSSIKPAIWGQVQMQVFEVEKEIISVAIIVRASSRHVGPRLISRGVDLDGHASNMVEIETLLSRKRAIASFVQVRGSIPFLWSQKPSWTVILTPIKLEGTPQQRLAAFEKHLGVLRAMYAGKKIVLVSLIESGEGAKDIEAKLSTEYERVFSECRADIKKDVSYLPFNLNVHVRGGKSSEAEPSAEGQGRRSEKWHASLIKQIFPNGPSFTYVDAKGEIVRRQDIEPRMSCLSSLDRSSAGQRQLSDMQSLAMLQDLMQGHCTVPELPKDVYQWMANGWADAGNCISRQYAGTIAKKSDLIRTGKSTLYGKVRDETWIRGMRHFNANRWDYDKFKVMKVIFGEKATWTTDDLQAPGASTA